MEQVTWLFVAYGVGLFCLLVNPEKAKNRLQSRAAWMTFAGSVAAPTVGAFLHRASEGEPGGSAGSEVFSLGVFVLSVFFLLSAVAPKTLQRELSSA